jgi:hypothetical protein
MFGHRKGKGANRMIPNAVVAAVEMIETEVDRLYRQAEELKQEADNCNGEKRCEYCRMVEKSASTLVAVYGFPMIYCPVCKRKLSYEKEDC